jgi:hypothetical protein
LRLGEPADLESLGRRAQRGQIEQADALAPAALDLQLAVDDAGDEAAAVTAEIPRGLAHGNTIAFVRASTDAAT